MSNPSKTSPFISLPAKTAHSNLALLSIKRDQTIAAVLRAPTASDPTDEITNTRFGSFPHSTLLNLPWGSQVLASNVGSRDSKRGKKRKRAQADTGGRGVDEGDANGHDRDDLPPAFEAAASGFAHILPPTPELWTMALPHRTQVVYTPDYSLILQRLKVRPGSRIIEAGAGSGSFTHAAARAVFSGFPDGKNDRSGGNLGKVYSFEYHEPRYEALAQEIEDHGLDGIVRVTHRDVYKDGFGFDDENSVQGPEPQADAIFLDLPAPWTALPHLTRKTSSSRPCVLNPMSSVHICTFSPCIEQAQRTVATLCDLGWVDVTMIELCHKRLDVRRDRVGLQEEGLRGVNPNPATVEESLGRLRELEGKIIDYHARRKLKLEEMQEADIKEEYPPDELKFKGGPGSRQERLNSIKEALKDRKVYKEGRLIHRTEPEIKTHTSFLVFAVLPREWTAEDEARCAAQWE